MAPTSTPARRPAPLPLALTMGEPAGVGGEVTLGAWLRRDAAMPCFFVIDDAARLQSLSARLGLKVPIERIDAPEEAVRIFPAALPVLDRPLGIEILPGKPAPAAAEAVRRSIETAVALVQQGRAGAVVTNPIHKEVLYAAGFAFPGHTEFLAALAGIATPPIMMLLCPELRVIPVTIHVSLADALRTLTTESIVVAAEITAAALRSDFGIARPRLAVAGLNPHAGEGGSMGTEEQTIIGPAIAALREKGIDATGPFPPDTLFTPRARRTYDAAICMYHDQALIPIKALDFDGGVNATLGLPFVRTSPDHGTALDIAGTGKAEPGSLMAALRVAADMTANRARS
ncbi:4-hydroxythreonine-4-phosphate dehydrogenase PdxA [Shumkonia mesophila]|uniref:4-hydroxythreonine-4-phosphate dehydrogenase PdxA n=1 Tax=Shumkonia mesophila TaxID=2838854 RepID=UPI00293467DC|nr:4-hydroxythreonine-4-phosphate dehydrogenase PdxA [Shumkonia mesophila]